MTEILTESFCERCGTRYTFQTAAPRKSGMKRLKVLSRGLKNYVLSDESTLEEALADARSDDERSISSEQLDAFHQTFNFCMSCRQYTCANCWNGPENLCLTCGPDLSREILPAAFPTVDPMAGIAPVELPTVAAAPANEDRAALAAASAWPDADLALAQPEPEPIVEPEALPEVVQEPELVSAAEPQLVSEAALEPEPTMPTEEPVVAALAPVEPPLEAAPPVMAPPPVTPVAPPTPAVSTPPPGHDERAAAAAAQTAALLARFRPDRDLDRALAEYEREAAEPEPAVEPEPVVEPAHVVEPEPVAPAAAAPAPPERRDDRVEIPTWRITAPDPTATTPSATPPVVTPSTTPTTPVWPPQPSLGASDGNAPQWPSAAFLSTPAPATRARDAMWAASSLEVVERAGGGVQSCVSCGLPLSATARFCRRCGSRQG